MKIIIPTELIKNIENMRGLIAQIPNLPKPIYNDNLVNTMIKVKKFMIQIPPPPDLSNSIPNKYFTSFIKTSEKIKKIVAQLPDVPKIIFNKNLITASIKIKNLTEKMLHPSNEPISQEVEKSFEEMFKGIHQLREREKSFEVVFKRIHQLKKEELLRKDLNLLEHMNIIEENKILSNPIDNIEKEMYNHIYIINQKKDYNDIIIEIGIVVIGGLILAAIFL